MKNKKMNLLLGIFYTAVIVLILFAFVDFNENEPKAKTTPDVEKIKIQTNEFGLIVDSLKVLEDVVKSGETLSTILNKYNVGNATIHRLAKEAKGIFDVRKIVLGKSYHIFTTSDNNDVKYFVYEKDPINYVVIDLGDSINVYSGKKEVTKVRKAVTGRINSSLYMALTENDVSPELVIELSEVYAWQIDFYRIQKGDNFKVIYEEEFVDDEFVGIGKIFGAYFNHNGEEFYAVNFKQDSVEQFFDENGNSLKKAFLKAPLKYTRISSRYTKRRFHPIQKRYKAHLGTDYAAPTGTPIYSVGDGEIVAASYSRGNGRYVKVRHNSVYTTQYLHMSRIKNGIRKGVRVKQGDVIGYVGSTGLATGPHLCYRFWKNGSQVDPFKEKIPPSHPVKEELLADYNKVKTKIISELDSLKIPEEKIKEIPNA